MMIPLIKTVNCIYRMLFHLNFIFVLIIILTNILFRTLGIDRDHDITFNQFMMAAGELKLRGTGSILRFNKNIREYTYAKG